MEETTSNMSNYEYAVELENINKSFGPYIANEDVTIRLRKGEIHALLGENGAGKSTLMNILFGLVKPDTGQIKINGEVVKIKNPNDATAHGIGMVHQHFRQIECFTVLQNIILGAEDSKHGILQMDTARQKVLELSKKYNFDIDLDAKISDITVGMQQRVEILKMLYRDNDVLIFDEPTAMLTPQEIEEFLILLKDLANSGKSILFISHKLNEIRAVANRCSVLRKGKYIDTFDVASVTEEEMSERMVGRKVNLTVEKEPAKLGDTILSVKNLSVASLRAEKDSVKNVSFEVKAGEIVCIAGIDGNGQSELIYALTGLIPTKSGSIYLKDKCLTDLNTRNRTLAGIGHIPEDRLKYGLVSECCVKDNMILQSYYTPAFNKRGMLRFDEIDNFTNTKVQEFDISVGAGTSVNAGMLSGGNQQKLVIAREMARDPDLLIASQPIRGLDVGAIEYIHNKLLEPRSAGRAILLVSFDLSEVMTLSDRILVMFEGEIVAELDPKQTTTNELGLYMSGAKRMK